MIADKAYGIAGTVVKVYPSDFPIKGKSFCRVFIDVVGEGDWEVVNEELYQVILDSIVLTNVPIGVYLVIQVATSTAELTQSPTDTSLILSMREDIIVLGANIIPLSELIVIKDELLNVSSISAEIVSLNTIKLEIDSLESVKSAVVSLEGIKSTLLAINAEPLRQSILDAEGNATIASTQAGLSAVSASESLGYRNEAEGFKNGALGYRNEAEGFRDEAELFAGQLDPTKIVAKDSPTGSAIMPSGTQLERSTLPMNGYMRYNTDLKSMEVFSEGVWGSVGGGATGGGTDHIFNLNDQVVTTDFTIPVGKNATTAGDVTIASGVTVTISSGSKWSII